MKIHRKSNETQVIGRCERVMIRHDIVGVRKEKVILIVTGPFPFGLITRYTQEMSAFGLLRQPQVNRYVTCCVYRWQATLGNDTVRRTLHGWDDLEPAVWGLHYRVVSCTVAKKSSLTGRSATVNRAVARNVNLQTSFYLTLVFYYVISLSGGYVHTDDNK